MTYPYLNLRQIMQYVPRIRHTVGALLCSVMFLRDYLILPMSIRFTLQALGHQSTYPPGLLQWHWGSEANLKNYGIYCIVWGPEIPEDKIIWWSLKSHFFWEFQAETLYVCPKDDFGHTYKVSAWNSHKKYNFCNTHISREYFRVKHHPIS